MKLIIAIALCFIASSSIFAQTESICNGEELITNNAINGAVQSSSGYLLESVITHGDNNNKHYQYIYNDGNLMINQNIFTIDGETLINDEQWTYSYDGAGNQTNAVIERWIDGAWNNYKRYYSTYGDNNNILTYNIDEWQTNHWADLQNTYYEYDANGNMLTLLNEKYFDNDTNVTKYIYVYGGDGNRDTMLLQEFIENEWISKSRRIYGYDDNNNMTIQRFETCEDGVWNTNSQYVYTYTPDNELSTMLIQTYSEDVWTNYMRYTYSYIADGTVSNLFVEFWQDEGWANYLNTTIEYDDGGNKLFEIYERWNGEDWIYNNRESREYDGAANLINWKSEEYDGDNWNLARHYNLFFDDYYGNEFRFMSCYEAELYWTDLSSANYGAISEFNATAAPNPFTDNAAIIFELKEAAFITIKVYDAMGNMAAELVNDYCGAGAHEVHISGAGLAHGVYYFIAKADESVSSGAFILVK